MTRKEMKFWKKRKGNESKLLHLIALTLLEENKILREKLQEKEQMLKEREIKMLTLPIKKKWFDMIVSGEKKEEYRNINYFYNSRLLGFYTDKMEHYVLFRNGYRGDSPTIKCKVRVKVGTGKPEWGAEPDKEYYVLEILSVERV